MSEWEEKLNTLLSDPDAMAQVMNMAQNLSQQMGQSGGSFVLFQQKLSEIVAMVG